MSKNSLELGSVKLAMVRSAPLRSKRKTFIEKQQEERKEKLIDYSLSSCPIWVALVDCLCLVVLKF